MDKLHPGDLLKFSYRGENGVAIFCFIKDYYFHVMWISDKPSNHVYDEENREKKISAYSNHEMNIFFKKFKCLTSKIRKIND